MEGSKSSNDSNQRQDSHQCLGKELANCQRQQMKFCLNGLESIKARAVVDCANGLDFTRMDCQLEENPISNNEGKKRQRSDFLISKGSNAIRWR